MPRLPSQWPLQWEYRLLFTLCDVLNSIQNGPEWYGSKLLSGNVISVILNIWLLAPGSLKVGLANVNFAASFSYQTISTWSVHSMHETKLEQKMSRQAEPLFLLFWEGIDVLLQICSNTESLEFNLFFFLVLHGFKPFPLDLCTHPVASVLFSPVFPFC